jgi:hypothetical protein
MAVVREPSRFLDFERDLRNVCISDTANGFDIAMQTTR